MASSAQIPRHSSGIMERITAISSVVPYLLHHGLVETPHRFVAARLSQRRADVVEDRAAVRLTEGLVEDEGAGLVRMSHRRNRARKSDLAKMRDPHGGADRRTGFRGYHA